MIVHRRRVGGVEVAMPRLAGGGVVRRVEVPHTEIRGMGCGRCIAEINILYTSRRRKLYARFTRMKNKSGAVHYDRT